MANLPKNDVTLVAADVEVKYPDYSSEVYADQVQTFTDLAKAQVHLIIYTGQWFLPTLSHWPTNIEYWWARYPNKFHPIPSETWSYEKLETETEIYGWYPDPQKKSPGPVAVWQCSGDRIKLPGCQGRAVDINLVNKTLPGLKAWWGITNVPPEYTYQQKLDILWREANEYPPAGWVTLL